MITLSSYSSTFFSPSLSLFQSLCELTKEHINWLGTLVLYKALMVHLISGSGFVVALHSSPDAKSPQWVPGAAVYRYARPRARSCRRRWTDRRHAKCCRWWWREKYPLVRWVIDNDTNTKRNRNYANEPEPEPNLELV